MIPGGYYLKARKTKSSWIAHTSPCIREIWDWLISEANHEDNGACKRGQLVRSYADIQEGLSWFAGYRKMTYSKWDCERALKALTKERMITTTKTTRGVLVTICNYDTYQNPANYERHSEDHKNATRTPQPPDTINKNVRMEEEKKEKSIVDSGESTAISAEVHWTEEEEAFERARKAYPSTAKRGHDTEWANFRKKHKDWREAVVDLEPAIRIQIQERILKARAKEFVAPWKNFQTWINQRYWEQAYNAQI